MERDFVNAKNVGIPKEYDAIYDLERLDFTCIQHANEIAQETKKYRDALGAIPDILLKDNVTGNLLYVDVKAKDIPIHYFLKGEYRHGFDNLLEYRYRSSVENIPVIILCVELTFQKNHTQCRNGKVSPAIDIGGYLIVNVNTPFIPQEYSKTKKYHIDGYYVRDCMRPIEDIRIVAGWKDGSN